MGLIKLFRYQVFVILPLGVCSRVFVWFEIPPQVVSTTLYKSNFRQLVMEILSTETGVWKSPATVFPMRDVVSKSPPYVTKFFSTCDVSSFVTFALRQVLSLSVMEFPLAVKLLRFFCLQMRSLLYFCGTDCGFLGIRMLPETSTIH